LLAVGALLGRKPVKSFGVAWILAGCSAANNEISSPAWGILGQSSFDAVVNAIAHINVKPPRLTKQGFVAQGAAAVAVAGSR